eukprot:gene4271-7607_t
MADTWHQNIVNLDAFIRDEIKKEQDLSEFLKKSKKFKCKQSEVFLWRKLMYMTEKLFNGEKIEEIYKSKIIKEEDVLTFNLKPEQMRPAYLIWTNHEENIIYLFLRGSRSITDVVTDLNCSCVSFKNGFCHEGFLKSAQWFDKHLKSIIEENLNLTNYKLRIVGHSLGSGVGAVLTEIWKEDFKNLECYAFACPSVLSLDLAEKTSDHIFTFVNEFDMIPRLSIFTVKELRNKVEEFEKNNVQFLNSWRAKATKFLENGKNWLTKEEENNPFIEIIDLTKIEEKKEEIDLMNSIVPLYPAGRIYQMHIIEERVYMAHTTQIDYPHFIII